MKMGKNRVYSTVKVVFPTFSLFFCTNNVKKLGCSLADTGAQAGADAGAQADADAGVTRAGTSQSREEKNSQDDNLFVGPVLRFRKPTIEENHNYCTSSPFAICHLG